MNMSKVERQNRVMHETGKDAYLAGTGHTTSREYLVGWRWVLRSPSGEYLDVDQYRHDLFDRNGFFTAY